MSHDSQPSKAEESEPAKRSTIEYWRGLAEIAREEKLDELEVEQDGVRISFRSGTPVTPEPQFVFSGAYPPQAGMPAAPLMPAANTSEPVAGKTEAVDENLVEIVSPMVGVFYRAPSPNDPNFVEVGDHIEPGKTVALVEAMKVFNEITSEVSGTVVEIKASSSDLVETGQVIITVRK